MELEALRKVGSSVPRSLALSLCVISWVGCGSSGDVHILGGACPFGTETRLFELDGPTLDGIALAATEGGGAYLAWSERSGAFGVALDHEGHASGARERLGPPCTGGLDVLAQSDGAVLVACAIQGDVERGDRGAVVTYARAADGHTMVADRRVGVGQGAGVALAEGEGHVLVGWQDATAGSSAAWMATVGDLREPLRLSRGGFRSTAPVIAFDGETRLVLWGELWNDQDGDPEGRIELQVGNRGPRVVSTLAYELALPALVPADDGAILAFRDRRPARTRPGMQLARLDAETRELSVHAGAPANAAGGGVAVACQGGVMVVAPRTHSRTERLVSVRRHGLDLEGLGPEQQIYEHGATFEWTDAACLGDRLLVVFGSRSSPLSPVGTVRSVVVDCAATPTE
jgi:hypothetical protein